MKIRFYPLVSIYNTNWKITMLLRSNFIRVLSTGPEGTAAAFNCSSWPEGKSHYKSHWTTIFSCFFFGFLLVFLWFISLRCRLGHPQWVDKKEWKRDNLNRKPARFSHEDHGTLRFNFSRENQSIDIHVPHLKFIHYEALQLIPAEKSPKGLWWDLYDEMGFFGRSIGKILRI